MGVAADDIERVRASVRLSDVVGEQVALRRVGRRLVGLCPFHGESTPSFSVNDELGYYKCFGCGVSGDVITFVRERDHLDFVGALESLAARVGITLTFDSAFENKEHSRRKRLLDALAKAADWYHDRLLTAPDAGAARAYLRSRDIDGTLARQFRIGWAPDAWDALAKALKLNDDDLQAAGLGFRNSSGRQTDAFRARVMFPILDERGDVVAFGGRVLPGADGPKYKNSAETAVYSKSRTLYGLSWAKAEIVRQDRVVVCEGYTDVIGFHQAGLPIAVATCGTALTEEHVRLLRGFAKRLVLAFDADAAGQGAADRVYAWERSHDVQVSVVSLPRGSDPADLARTDPAALVAATDAALPFLAYRIDRALAAMPLATPEDRARAASSAMGIVNEHPNEIVRTQYAGAVAMRIGLPAQDLVSLAQHPERRPEVIVRQAPAAATVAPEQVALAAAVHAWDRVGAFTPEELFVDPEVRAAAAALRAAAGDLQLAVDTAAPGAAERLREAAVEEPPADPWAEVRRAITTAARREIAAAASSGDHRSVAAWRLALEELEAEITAGPAAGRLVGWLTGSDTECG